MSSTLYHSKTLRNQLFYKIQTFRCGLEMGKLKTILEKFILKISIKYLLFIFMIIIGCSYQVIHVSKVYFEFETKIDLKYNEKSEVVIPMVSFCMPTVYSFRNSSKSKSIKGMSPVQVYNQTYNFDEVFIQIKFFRVDGKSVDGKLCPLGQSDPKLDGHV